jgi:hypothetical protein
MSWSIVAILLGAVAVLALGRWRNSRMEAGLVSQVEVTVRVPARLYRIAQNPVLGLAIASLTGVSITFCPLGLILVGGSAAKLGDWRIIAFLLVIYFVPGFYMALAGPVFRHAWEHRKGGAAL